GFLVPALVAPQSCGNGARSVRTHDQRVHPVDIAQVGGGSVEFGEGGAERLAALALAPAARRSRRPVFTIRRTQVRDVEIEAPRGVPASDILGHEGVAEAVQVEDGAAARHRGTAPEDRCGECFGDHRIRQLNRFPYAPAPVRRPVPDSPPRTAVRWFGAGPGAAASQLTARTPAAAPGGWRAPGVCGRFPGAVLHAAATERWAPSGSAPYAERDGKSRTVTGSAPRKPASSEPPQALPAQPGRADPCPSSSNPPWAVNAVRTDGRAAVRIDCARSSARRHSACSAAVSDPASADASQDTAPASTASAPPAEAGETGTWPGTHTTGHLPGRGQYFPY